MKTKPLATESRPLPAASVGDLQAATRKRLRRMKVGSPRDGVEVERRPLSVDRPKLKAKLRAYRRLRAALEKNVAKKLKVDGLDALMAAAEDVGKILAGRVREKRAFRKGH